jgi:wyosine [tRNA(Phe)-imidazoG37] synthetase (radical SAM superfamily)
VRTSYFNPFDIVQEVKQQLKIQNRLGVKIDHVAIVPDGEPTLDSNLEELPILLKKLPVKIGITTNGSLLNQEDVFNALLNVDTLSVKLDSVYYSVWKELHSPLSDLKFERLLNAIYDFSMEFKGKLLSETMLVKGINDYDAHLIDLAVFIAKINPSIAFLATPTLNKKGKNKFGVVQSKLYEAKRILKSDVKNVKILVGHEDQYFSFAGDLEKTLLDLITIQPLRREDIIEFLYKAKADVSFLEMLVQNGKLVVSDSENGLFYMRSFSQQ